MASRKDPENQLKEPILTKETATPEPAPAYYAASVEHSHPNDSPPPYEHEADNKGASSLASITGSITMQRFLQQTAHATDNDLLASGTIQQLMNQSLNQVTQFETKYSGSYQSEEYEFKRSFDHGSRDEPSRHTNHPSRGKPRLSRSRTCHQKSSIGVVLGSIWIRTSSLKIAEESSITAGQMEVITSFIFYPASWLNRVGVSHGAEANLQWSPTGGWKFNISAVRAVPESALIFDMCRQGNVDGVQMLLSRGDASIKDTSPKGWTPLHVSCSRPKMFETKGLTQT
jgi:hypothetical protein